MKNLIIPLLPIIFLISSCSKQTDTTQIKSGETKITTIKENVSYVTAKILDIYKKSDTSYTLKILILESNSDENLPNFAVVDDEISVKPAFILNEIGAIDIDDPRNQNLIELSGKEKGEIVKLVIKRTLKEGWLVIDQSK